MSTLIPSSFTSAPVLAFQNHHRLPSRLQVKAQSLRDEGRSSNIVDSNMKILMERMELMKTKERLERSYIYGLCGWDYNNYSNNMKIISSKHKERLRHEYTKSTVVALVCGTLSLPLLIATFLLYNFSVLAHFL